MIRTAVRKGAGGEGREHKSQEHSYCKKVERAIEQNTRDQQFSCLSLSLCAYIYSIHTNIERAAERVKK